MDGMVLTVPARRRPRITRQSEVPPPRPRRRCTAAYACRMTPPDRVKAVTVAYRGAPSSDVPAAASAAAADQAAQCPATGPQLDYVVGALVGVILLRVHQAQRRHPGRRRVPYGAVPYRPLRAGVAAGRVPGRSWRSSRWPCAAASPSSCSACCWPARVVVTMLTGPQDGGALTYFLPVAYVLYLVAATYERRRAAVRVLAAVFATLVADAVLMHLTGGGVFPRGGLVSVALCVIIAWFTGYIVRQRRRYAVRLQDEAASKAVAEERLRIARELHDVVAHSMSVIAVQAGYGQYVIDTQPGRRARRPRGHPGDQPGGPGRDAPDARRPAPGGPAGHGRAGRPAAPAGRDSRPAAPATGDAAGCSAAVPRARPGRPGPAGLAHRERGRPGRRDPRRAAEGAARRASTCPPTGSSRRR